MRRSGYHWCVQANETELLRWARHRLLAFFTRLHKLLHSLYLHSRICDTVSLAALPLVMLCAGGTCLRLLVREKSMGKLSRILSIAAMVTHLMVSCCHCSRQCEDKSCSDPCQGMAAPTEESRGRLCDHSHSELPCCGAAKSPALHPRAKGGVHLGPRSTTSFALSLERDPPGLACNSQVHSLAGGRLLLPVRLHLANRVLLI
jgi:hypothetical protein